MKFFKGSTQPHYPPYFTTNIASVENLNTKIEVDEILTSKQISKQELKAIKLLNKSKLVVKPADTNLGIVVINSSNYMNQCLDQLTSKTYIRVETMPEEELNTEHSRQL